MRKLLLAVTVVAAALAVADSTPPSKTFLTAIDPAPENIAMGATNHVIYVSRFELTQSTLASATSRISVGSQLTNAIVLGPGRWFAAAACVSGDQEGPITTNLTLISLWTTQGIREVKP